ncbi:MAG: hypothetical protein JW793_09155 [Acidobacteria bacterium]|nr:hypothetical protein [Acidobacteriota bacterium]
MKKSTFDSVMGTRKTLRWRIVVVLLTVALLPLALAGIGSWIVFGRLLEDKSLDQLRTIVENHARAIEFYLLERENLLSIAAETASTQHLGSQAGLSRLLADLNRLTQDGFVDLGLIDADGRHASYVGPYDLMGPNYRDAEWFGEVMASGVYISDVFLGKRQVPHCIVAVRFEEAGHMWILRGTINSRSFDDLVQATTIGGGAEAYIVNREGLYQTTPAQGRLLDEAPRVERLVFRGVRDRRVQHGISTLIQVTTWLNNDRWLLVVQQPLAAVQAPVNRAITAGALVVAVAVVLLIVTTFFATWHLTSRIEKANAEREEMSRAFVRSAKLASIGELATGLAHEINNPLAIISAEETNLSDLLAGEASEPDWRRQALESIARCKAQVQRCGSITGKMLQFGRRQEPRPEPTDIAPRLAEILELMKRRAAVRNVALRSDIEPGLPRALVDPVELEQVLVNLINNAVDAMPAGGEAVTAARRVERGIELSVRDSGTGIPADILDRIFEPFFTTKPAGKGTGLGLSVCYGIVTSWGGSIHAESEPGKGTRILMVLPAEAGTRRKPDTNGTEQSWNPKKEF